MTALILDRWAMHINIFEISPKLPKLVNGNNIYCQLQLLRSTASVEGKNAYVLDVIETRY